MHSENILTIMSAIGIMNLEKFKAIYESFQIKETNGYTLKPYELLGYLEALGHCEVDYKKRAVAVCPPGIALIPSEGLPRALLVGARDGQIVSRLSSLAIKNADKFRLDINSTLMNESIPDRILIEATSKSVLKQIADKLEVSPILNWPVSWSLLQLAPAFSEKLSTLKYELCSEPGWIKRFFHSRSLSFNLSKDQASVRLAYYINPYTQQQITWLWNGETAVEIDRNWGRYIMLHHNKVSILIYDRTSRKLAVPITVPLPREYAKSATMCSGFSPVKVELRQGEGILPTGVPVLVYQSVPDNIANEMAVKLGQQLIHTEI